MTDGIGKCVRIRCIVRMRQMLRRWRHKAASAGLTFGTIAAGIPADVPLGHVAVCVGTSCKRYVVRATYLNHPVFEKLLNQAEEEFGFTNSGPLVIPCDESLFEDILRFLSRNYDSGSSKSSRFTNFEEFQRYCNVGRRSIELLTESRPLLQAFSEKSVC